MLKYLPDRQVKNVYKWEDQFCKYEPDKTEQQLNQLFCKFRMIFRINDAELHFKEIDGMKMETSYQLEYDIVLHPDHHSYHVLSHEWAHLAIYHWYEHDDKKSIEPHGEEWLTLYMILLCRVCGHSVDKIVRSAYRSKLRFFETIVRKYGYHTKAEAVQNGQQRREDAGLVC